MVICPMCEHQQEFGFECEQCGKDLGGFAGLGPPPVMNEQVEGLEVTVPDRVGEVAVERVGELEVTRFAEVNVAADVTPDLELSRMPDVGEVAVERIELSEDRFADDGVKTAAPTGVVKCRYCGTPGQLGSVCERCGYKLAQVAVVATGSTKAVQISARCRSCGAPAIAGQRCTECGHDVPFPDA